MASPHTSVLLRRSATSKTLNSPRLPPQNVTVPSRRPTRHFTTSPRPCIHQTSARWQEKERFRSRLGTALKNTKIQWYPIPIGLGIGFLGFVQFYKTQAREKERLEREALDGEPGGKPKKRPRVRPDGPWQVQIMSTLPLKAMSRLWGKFNEIPIPYYLRIPGFKLYALIFGVNLDEVAEPDLRVYPNLAAFFYRTLKPGARPLDPNPNALLSPADGRVLQFGKIEGGDIEQVKGVTYSVDALLGQQQQRSPTPSLAGTEPSSFPFPSAEEQKQQQRQQQRDKAREVRGDEELVAQDEEFARVNGISYTIPGLLSGGSGDADSSRQTGTAAGAHQQLEDQATSPPSPSAVSEVRADLALGERPWWDILSPPGQGQQRTALYYAVVYLAPGDYHRYHSPASWVVERRRHFAGELYSVSPYLQRTMPGLFTLNERVALLGRWRWGFFGFVPVGATNVGSIVVNFDRELRTNSLLTDTAADRAAEQAAARGEPYAGFAEATYEAASPVLGGYALRRGEEMGGFRLGSTVVLVFEAPVPANPGARGGFRWVVEKGRHVKMGEALGVVEEEEQPQQKQ